MKAFQQFTSSLVSFKRLLVLIGLLGVLGGLSFSAQAQTANVDPVSRNLRVAQQRGVDIVDIVPPNANGLSHNLYNRFDVGPSGLILNNIRHGESANTVLTGHTLLGNPNLTGKSAAVILNEVLTGGSASALLGQIEVAGPQADVVLVNPHGITCEGCGFINTRQATLSTGVSQVSNSRLEGFEVQRGTITIRNNASGQGLVATGTRLLDLVTTEVQGNGDVQLGPKGQLQVREGTQFFDYTEKPSSVQVATGVDLSLLGGQSVGTVNLSITDQGIGVKRLQGMANSSGSFVLNSDGTIRGTRSTRNLARSNASVQLTQNTSFTDNYSGSGATLIDIPTPRGGVSHSFYQDFNITNGGLIFNNNDNSSISSTVDLGRGAGISVGANPNLTSGAAEVIISEVVVANDSLLEGPAEVAGPSADVVIANPYGITCSGCSFFNMNRLTLTTGTPSILSPSTGTIRVQRGHLSVESNGLDADNASRADLVARSIKIAGPVQAKDIRVIAGLNDYDYGTRTISADNLSYTGDGSDNYTFAVNVTENGSITASNGGIYLDSSSADGVQVLRRTDDNQSLVSSSELIAQAQGQLYLEGGVSVTDNISLSTDSDNLTLNNIQLDARNTSISSAGTIYVTDGSLHADEVLSIAASSYRETDSDNVIDNRTAGGSGLVGGKISINLNEWATSTLDRTAWEADNIEFEMHDRARFEIDAGSVLTTKNLSGISNINTGGYAGLIYNMGQLDIVSVNLGNVDLSNNKGTVSITQSATLGRLNNGGAGSSFNVTGDVSTRALYNYGLITTGGDLTVTEGDKYRDYLGDLAIAGDLNLTARAVTATKGSNGAVSNIIVGGNAQITGRTILGYYKGDFSNPGNWSVAGDFSFDGINFSNTANISSSGELSINSETTTNSGKLESDADISIFSSNVFKNSSDGVYADGDLDISGKDVINLRNGTLSGQNITIDATGVVGNGMTYRNYGYQAGSYLDYDDKQAQSTAKILADKQLNITSQDADIINAGFLRGVDGVSLTAGDELAMVIGFNGQDYPRFSEKYISSYAGLASGGDLTMNSTRNMYLSGDIIVAGSLSGASEKGGIYHSGDMRVTDDIDLSAR